LLNGAADRFFRRDERLYLRALRSGRVRLIEGAAHMANLDQPEAYTQALRDFATEIVTVR
jgi:pimeloyl-ACP methyl ester carboxylesterase